MTVRTYRQLQRIDAFRVFRSTGTFDRDLKQPKMRSRTTGLRNVIAYSFSRYAKLHLRFCRNIQRPLATRLATFFAAADFVWKVDKDTSVVDHPWAFVRHLNGNCRSEIVCTCRRTKRMYPYREDMKDLLSDIIHMFHSAFADHFAAVVQNWLRATEIGSEDKAIATTASERQPYFECPPNWASTCLMTLTSPTQTLSSGLTSSLELIVSLVNFNGTISPPALLCDMVNCIVNVI